MEDDTLRLVQRLNETSDLLSHDPLERHMVRSDHIDRDPARPERRRHFEADETRAHDHHVFGPLGLVDDGTRIREGTEVVHMRIVCAWDGQAYRVGACGDQE